MIITSILLILLIIFLDVAFCEVNIISDIVFLFVLVNFLYWFRRYKLALVAGIIASIFIDLVMQREFGESLFSLILPILLLSIFDNILRIDTKVSSIVFAVVSTICSIFISDFLFDLLYLNLSLNMTLLLKRMFFSSGFLITICLLFGNSIEVKERKRSRYE